MIKLLFIRLVTCFILLFSVTKMEAQTATNKGRNKTSLSTLNGSWRIVSINENGRINNRGQLSNIIAFNDGFYSWFGPDSTGNWNRGGAGTYEISGNTLKQEIQYSSWPERIGTTNLNEIQMKGDTVYLRFKQRINPKGEDITANFPASEYKWVKSKQ